MMMALCDRVPDCWSACRIEGKLSPPTARAPTCKNERRVTPSQKQLLPLVIVSTGVPPLKKVVPVIKSY